MENLPCGQIGDLLAVPPRMRLGALGRFALRATDSGRFQDGSPRPDLWQTFEVALEIESK
jgi:hypothetical protein